jgi:hypothetical protein
MMSNTPGMSFEELLSVVPEAMGMDRASALALYW